MLILKCENAKKAAAGLSRLDTGAKNGALLNVIKHLKKNKEIILRENQKDLTEAKNKKTSGAMLDRLALNDKRIDQICEGITQVIELEDPIGETLETICRPNGLIIEKTRAPLGVIGIIYESRPNVTVDAAVLCFKSSNAVILRGGSDALNSNKILVTVMQEALKDSGIDENCIQIIEDTDRRVALEFMKMNGYIDVLIPRGGAGLIQSVVNNATVPVIETGTGNCHVFVGKHFDEEKAINIIVNAKTSRPSVCNAIETVLIEEEISAGFIPKLVEKLENVEIRGCEKTRKISDFVKAATDDDYKTEFLDYILAMKIVSDIDEAISHINKYGTKHSECIITEDREAAEKFMKEVDAAAVYYNASTRFTDGFEFGLGAEIGISTQKIHARGPMGLRELTTYKFNVYGTGQVR